MSRRTERVGEAIREVVSTAILFEVKDPRVKGVTVLGCDVSGDLRNAKVRVSIMGTEAEQNLCLHGLTSSAGFLQRRIADRLDLRFTPVLTIVADDSVKKSLEMSRLIRETAEADAAHGKAAGTTEEEADSPTDDGTEPTDRPE
jgi:ribosome-binding factor A